MPINAPRRKYRYRMPVRRYRKILRRGMKRQLLKRPVKAETKRLDYAYDVDSVVPNSALLNGCGQGLLDYQRIGSEVMFRSIFMRGTVTFPDSTNFVRLLLVIDTQPNAALPALADLLTFPGVPTISYIAPKALQRFQILADKVYCGGANGPVAKNVRIARKLNFKTRYLGAGNTIADINTNSLIFFYITDSGVVPNPNVELAIRVTYTDS